MRVVVEQSLGATYRILRFSEAEKAALWKAATIADQARELWAASLGGSIHEGTLDGEDMSTELAMIEIAVSEVVDGIEIEYDPDGGLITQIFGSA